MNAADVRTDVIRSAMVHHKGGAGTVGHEARDNGKENGNYYSIIGYILKLHRDNGNENGSYYVITWYI